MYLPKVLVEKNSFYIAQCKKCNRIGLTFKNIMAGFDMDEFMRFSEVVVDMDFHNSSILFPDGEEHVIIQTCHMDIQFTFKETEFNQLVEGLLEAILLLEANSILNK